MLLGQLRSRTGSHLGLEMRATLLPLGTRMDCGRGAKTPTRPGSWGGDAPPPQTDRLPRRGSDASRKGVGPTRAAGNAHPTSTEHSRMSLREAPSPGGGSEVEEDEPQSSRGTCLERAAGMTPVTAPAPRTADRTAAMPPRAWKSTSQPRAMQTTCTC